MSATQHNQPARARDSLAAQLLQWLVMAIVGLAILSLAAAHLPPRAKLLGVFAVGYGLLAGWGLSQLARLAGLPRFRGLSLLSMVLIGLGQMGVAVETWRLQAADIRRQAAQHQSEVAGKLIPLLGDKYSPEDPEGKAQFESTRNMIAEQMDRQQHLLAVQTSFSGYLRRRLAALGAWGDPWPALFWITEITTGSLAGFWLFHRLAGSLASGSASTTGKARMPG